MKIEIVSPTTAKLTEATSIERAQLERLLAWRDKAAEQNYLRTKKSRAMREKMGEQKHAEEVARIKGQIQRNCFDPNTETFLAGLVEQVKAYFSQCEITSNVRYPEKGVIAWAKPPPALRPYQQEAVDALTAIRHGGIEAGTGAGKSLMLLYLVRNHGLRSVVMAPSKNIAKQLFELFQTYLGKMNVGFFGDSKKESKKKVTIGIAKSFAMIEEGSEHWKDFSNVELFIADESHQCPARTLEQSCIGVFGGASYRYFVSGTQMRSDGRDLVLEGLVGPIVYTITVEKLVEMGFLAKPLFYHVEVPSVRIVKDAAWAFRSNFVRNHKVYPIAASIIKKAVDKNKQVLVLIDEIVQGTELLKHINMDKTQVGFAHSAASSHEKLPEDYKKSDVEKEVSLFNQKQKKVLIGTSCIATGTDIQTADVVVYMMGGVSEVQLRQAIGRGTRKPEGKENFVFLDFRVKDCAHLDRHFLARNRVYNEMSGTDSKLIRSETKK